MRQTAAALPADRITFQGGLSGVWLLDELRAGASGAMTGFPYPEILVEIWQSFRDGDEQHAAELYYRYLPLMLLDGQAGTGVSARKIVQVRRGQIKHAVVRAPGLTLDARAKQDLLSLLDTLELAKYDAVKV
jgi:4-hydroxy-tetrahydrodipicolinate synthase